MFTNALSAISIFRIFLEYYFQHKPTSRWWQRVCATDNQRMRENERQMWKNWYCFHKIEWQNNGNLSILLPNGESQKEDEARKKIITTCSIVYSNSEWLDSKYLAFNTRINITTDILQWLYRAFGSATLLCVPNDINGWQMPGIWKVTTTI